MYWISYRHAINQFEFFASLTLPRLVTPTTHSTYSSGKGSSSGGSSNLPLAVAQSKRGLNVSGSGNRHAKGSRQIIEILDSDDEGEDAQQCLPKTNPNKRTRSTRNHPTDSGDDEIDASSSLTGPISTRSASKGRISSHNSTLNVNSVPAKSTRRKKTSYLVIDSDSEESAALPVDQVSSPTSFALAPKSLEQQDSTISRPPPSSSSSTSTSPRPRPLSQVQTLPRPKQHMDTKYSFLHGAAKLIDASLGMNTCSYSSLEICY